MTEKSHIIETLGENALLLPSLINGGLTANDQAKYLLTLLQAARHQADHPEEVPADLQNERLATGISLEGLDQTPAQAKSIAPGRYRIPQAEVLCQLLKTNLEQMLAPLRASGIAQQQGLDLRFDTLTQAPWQEGDEMAGATVDRLTAGDRKGPDTVHLLIMDMHRALNQLQADIAPESIDGAQVYGIGEEDRPLIAAFMAGLNRTRCLKFDHPGLATTATRTGESLVLQNDIGTTDAHILVIHVTENRTRITYTDVHLQRLLFFQGLFADWAMDWEDTRSKADTAMEDGLYHLSVGCFQATDPQALTEFLHFLGSRLVFLIDWNRARKRLRLMLPKKETAGLLHWAAENDLGHMGFLRVGGEQAIFDAVGYVAPNQVSIGARLDDLLGVESALAYLQFVFRTATQGLLEKKNRTPCCRMKSALSWPPTCTRPSKAC